MTQIIHLRHGALHLLLGSVDDASSLPPPHSIFFFGDGMRPSSLGTLAAPILFGSFQNIFCCGIFGPFVILPSFGNFRWSTSTKF
jgi:hypothetical protein